MINTEIRQLEDNIINILNNSPIEIEVKRLVVSNIMFKLEKESDKIIIAEMRQEENNAESIR